MSKIQRKQRRCQTIVSKDTNLNSLDTPSQFLAICNAGLSTGLQREILLEEALKYGKVKELLLIPHKSYCFLQCDNIQSAIEIFNGLHGRSKLGQNGTVLYLSYFEGVPLVELSENEDLPPGLIILPEFVTEEEEKMLLNATKSKESTKSLKNREVHHFGYEFRYGSNNVDENNPLLTKIPEECNFLWSRLKNYNSNLNWYEPDQLTVNIYSPGQGIPPHVDTHSSFLDPILSLSLESDVIMEFKNESGKHLPVLLPARSLLIMSGESRYIWTHGIVPRSMDIVHSINGLTISNRKKRTSLTFRRLRKSSCDCSYSSFCDSKKNSTTETVLTEIASKLEIENVHKVYDKIAHHFSETRHKPWPNVENFINSFPIGSILLDIGCGNGKYLGTNQYIAKIGCDRSRGLLKICHDRKFNIFQCDCLYIPFRDNSIDGCISIALIHHLATEERRIQAISEMSRVLVPNGRALIYVWAKNQEFNSKSSKYLNDNKPSQEVQDKDKEIVASSEIGINLPVHINRTRFKQQDVFVPWKTKIKSELEDNLTLLRYYHVFDENELENNCRKIGNIKIESSYYDQGNWCVIFQKLS